MRRESDTCIYGVLWLPVPQAKLSLGWQSKLGHCPLTIGHIDIDSDIIAIMNPIIDLNLESDRTCRQHPHNQATYPLSVVVSIYYHLRQPQSVYPHYHQHQKS